MKKRIWILVAAATLLLAGCGSSRKPEHTYRQITQEEAAKLMDEQSDSTAYKILYGQIHSLVVGASKNQVNPVLAVSALRWGELETFTIR